MRIFLLIELDRGDPFEAADEISFWAHIIFAAFGPVLVCHGAGIALAPI
jgi:hypothetical protein